VITRAADPHFSSNMHSARTILYIHMYACVGIKITLPTEQQSETFFIRFEMNGEFSLGWLVVVASNLVASALALT
jgi:hypothetical protein